MVVCCRARRACSDAGRGGRAGRGLKPIAYNHFQSRAGLLCALYDRYYTGHIEELTKALERAATVEEAAKVIAQAYVDCVEQSGLWQRRWLAL
ncbi:hypothetical protein GCM10020258_52850 [Sphingomonas yabuuchiae]